MEIETVDTMLLVLFIPSTYTATRVKSRGQFLCVVGVVFGVCGD